MTEYIISRDGSDLATVIGPEDTTLVDTIAGAIGTTYLYKLKVVNEAGDSDYTEEITVTVGSVPNAPSNLVIVS